MILADTNILLRLAWRRAVGHVEVESAVDALRLRQLTLCYAAQGIAELWNVCTRPAAHNGFGLTVEDADQRVEAIESQMDLLPDTPEAYHQWRDLVVRYRVSGRQVHDARLVAVMLANGVSRLLTLNDTDFKRYADVITIIHPRSVEEYLRASESE